MEETQILNSNKFKYIKPSIIIINVDISYMIMTSGTGKYVYTRDSNCATITIISDTRESSTLEKIWKGIGGHGYDPDGNKMFAKPNNFIEE
jgi:hypothetical protein